MSGIMSPNHGGGQSNASRFSHNPQPGHDPRRHGPPSTSQSTKSAYALELEQQMREKKERDRQARELDRGLPATGGGRRSRVVSQLRDTVQESRAQEQSGIQSSRQRMLGGGAMANMLGGGSSQVNSRNDRGYGGGATQQPSQPSQQASSPHHSQQQQHQPSRHEPHPQQPAYGDQGGQHVQQPQQPQAYGGQPQQAYGGSTVALPAIGAASQSSPDVQALVAENSSLKAEVEAMRSLLEQYYARFGPLPALK